MKPGNILDENRQIFVEESRDLLRRMESALLVLEEQPRDEEAVNALFRAAHTIKGSAGLFTFDRVVAFTHVLENVLDRVRSGAQTIDPSLTELALRCADHVGSLLDVIALTGSDADLEKAVAEAGLGLVERLTAYLGPKGVAAAAKPAEKVVAAAPNAHGDGPVVERDTWHLSLRFGPDVLRSGMDPLSFLRYLGTLGDIKSIVTVTNRLPDAASFDPETSYLGFEVLLQSVTTEKAIADVFEFVRDDSTIGIFAPHASISQYRTALAALPDDRARAEMLASWIAVAAVRAEELATVNATAAVPTTEPSVREVPAHAPREAKSTSDAQGRFVRVPADKLDRLITLVGELVIAASASSTLARTRGDTALREAGGVVDGLVEEIRDSALRLRMVQIGETFNRFKRVVRDVSRELDKEIELVLTGGETELDKSVVERINDPLTHIVRNAIDHGIEDREARLAAGKPACGELHMHAYHDSGSVVIEVRDDGRGLNRDRILQKARERGLVAPDQILTDDQVLALIFEPGFSTAEKVTNLSGRGVGMDVVRKNINELRGSVSLASVVGGGTTITIRLPLTLAIIDGFLVRVGSGSYVIPLDAVFECIELPSTTDRPSGGDYINLRDQVLPLLNLREMFGLGTEAPPRQSVVVLQSGGRRAGLVVDQLLGEQQTVIKPLGKVFATVPGIGGSTVLGSGEVALILDVAGLVQRALSAQVAASGRRLGGAVAKNSSDNPKIKGTKDARVQ